MGFDRAEVELLHAEMPTHGFLWFAVVDDTVFSYPPLPRRARKPIPHQSEQR
jgi:hypothetical protein